MGRVMYGFADRLEEWYQSATHHKGRRAWRRSTARVYKSRCRVLQTYFGNRAVKRITTLDITDFFAESDLADYTQVLTAKILHQFFNHAIQRGWTKFNPVSSLQFRNKKRRRHRIVLDPQEVWALLKAAETNTSPKLYPFVVVAFYTGLRAHNVLELRRTDLLQDWIVLGEDQMKTGKELRVPTHPILRRLAHEFPINRCYMTMYVATKRAVEAAGLNPAFTIHGLRRTVATLLEEISSYAVAQALLGHSPDFSTTATYVRPTDRQVRQAVLSLPDFTGDEAPPWPPG